MLNQKQKQVAEGLEGIYLVDAGAGTGKTFTLTKKYEKILEEGIKPEQILLVTFTNNAAESMKEKIINSCYEKYNIKELLDAPISTFHSFCNTLLRQNGFDSPKIIGIEDNLSKNFQIIENAILEERMFNKFFNDFQNKHFNKYVEPFSLINNKSKLVINLIKKLCCHGIFPTKEGWFNDSEKLLIGNWKNYSKIFEKINKENLTEKGNKKDSDIASSFKAKLRYKLYHNMPSNELAFEGKLVNEDIARQSFREDRKNLIEFIHHIYFEYVKYSIKRNKINFDFLVMLTFIMLFKDHKLREIVSFDYVIVDEFQDTNEIQFMLTLLLMKNNNLCVVGDWKQGIYGFRNATIENITKFDKKLDYFKEILNSDYERIKFDTQYTKISFDVNYRSSQKILDFSENSLIVKGSNREFMDIPRIKNQISKLNSGVDLDTNSNIEFLQTKEKKNEEIMILEKIQSIVNNEGYMIKEFVGKDSKKKGNSEYIKRKIEYKDIAILSRTRTFGLNLQNLALEYNIPLNYDGGIELFKTEPAIILLGWLKIMLNVNKRSGWIPILEEENYEYSQIKNILIKKNYPGHLLKFRKGLLKQKEGIKYLIEKIFSYYDINCVYSNALIVELDRLFNLSLISLSELVYFIEQNILTNQTYNINLNNSNNAITVETIHASKGLEYPVVFIVDCNESRFPSKKMGEPIIFYDEIIGLRAKKHKANKNNYDYIFNNLSTDLLLSRLHSDFDEERRLLYVAITRAKQYLWITSNKNSSWFFKGLCEKVEHIENPQIRKMQIKEDIEYSEIEMPTIFKE